MSGTGIPVLRTLIFTCCVGGYMADLVGDRSANVCGDTLEACNLNPITGVFEDGYCSPRKDGGGTYVVCAVINEVYLKLVFSIYPQSQNAQL